MEMFHVEQNQISVATPFGWKRRLPAPKTGAATKANTSEAGESYSDFIY